MNVLIVEHSGTSLIKKGAWQVPQVGVAIDGSEGIVVQVLMWPSVATKRKFLEAQPAILCHNIEAIILMGLK